LNIEWLITGRGKMIKDPYWQELGTAGEYSYKKLVYAPLVSRYAQTEYICRLNDKSYIDTLPTFPVAVEYESKGSYVCFEMWNNSMNDGSDNSYKPGDILICREMNHAARNKSLYFNIPKSFVIIHEKEGITATQIIAHSLAEGLITVHSPNPSYENSQIRLQDVKKLFNVLRFQRIVNY
jgi:hypothetical protein